MILHGHSLLTIVLYVRSYDIMERCWRQSPEERPTFSEINRKLSGLIEQSDSDNYISVLELSEVPTESVDSLEKEGTEEKAAVREQVNTLSSSC